MAKAAKITALLMVLCICMFLQTMASHQEDGAGNRQLKAYASVGVIGSVVAIAYVALSKGRARDKRRR